MAKSKPQTGSFHGWRKLDEQDGFATECMKVENGCWVYRTAQYKISKNRRRLIAVQPLGLAQARPLGEQVSYRDAMRSGETSDRNEATVKANPVSLEHG